MQHAPGSMIGRYRIEALLGAGGMGEVYRAHDTELSREVALKVVAKEAGADLVARMRQEARAASALSHPNAATVFDVGEVEGRPYIVMELIEGESLRTYVNDRERATLSERLEILRQIALALASAHDRGLVHRDVKPENVMIRTDGVAKLLDFGIAKAQTTAIDASAPTEPGSSSSLTRTGTSIGSPAYMAPEQVRGQPLDGRADQFAWGVTAFELLSGKLPWKSAGSVLEMAGSILHEKPLPLHTLAPDVSEQVADAVHKALEKDRDDRHAGMRDVAKALGDVGAISTKTRVSAGATTDSADKPSVDAVTHTSLSRSETPRKAPWSVFLVAAVVLVGGGAVLLSIVRQRAEEKEAAKPRGPILGLDDEATKRLDEEIDDPALASARAASASAASTDSAPPGQSAAAPRHMVVPCGSASVSPECAKDNSAWCTPQGARVACCVKGLVATPNGRCACAKGGVTDEKLAKSGCAEAPKEYNKEIQKNVRQHFDQMRACYETALKANPKVQGNVAVSFSIVEDGSVYDTVLAGSSAPDPTFQDCIVEVFSKLSFAPPPNGHVRVTYPMAFSPGD